MRLLLWLGFVLVVMFPALPVLSNENVPDLSQTSIPFSCRWTSSPRQIIAQAHELHQVWEIKNNPLLWSSMVSEQESFHAFRAAVRQRFPVLDPFLRFAIDSPELTIAHKNRPKMMQNPLLAMNHQAGQIAEINCLESLLLSEQTARQEMLTQPSEFGAFILKSADGHLLRIYFSTQDQPGLKLRAEVMAEIEKAQAQGWRVWAHLHNHNFFYVPDHPFASPSPSQTDVQFARQLHKGLQLENMWVTNGFHTIHINAADFAVFRDHSDTD